ncbi:Fic/DOC family protein [Pigmentiphaga humi]|uniref:Fic/DOC family protein n=1 Tax=Pigmentiphaga humi TaxID=2478468 RepID=A0A3P4B4H4_9BURK|nr:Fic family protein [Pigmentiphaga humi]VCU70055.1 Fic/DOC family protein [Pigmentiphaga humi]
MTTAGYAQLIDRLALPVRPLARTAHVSGSVNRRIDSVDRVLFPRGVALEDSVIGHLEFALRHEGVNLEVIDALFATWREPGILANRLQQAPNGEPIRRACHLWEWLTEASLPIETVPKAGYVDLYSPGGYVTAEHPINDRKFRVRNNALGTADFSPIVRREAMPAGPSLPELCERARTTLASVADPALYERALSYLYLSETRSSFAIEHESPSSDKQERFVQLLRRAGEMAQVSEEWLVSLQNAAVRNVYSQEASYRTKQNWLEDATGRITFFPVPQADLARSMRGWEDFTNDSGRCTDVLVKAAISAFGFVYLHPFLDGNGRLHRFLIHHVLTHSGLLPAGTVVPVSAVIQRHIPEYLGVLTGFSQPVTRLWNYVRGDPDPYVTAHPGSGTYRFFDASNEVAFLHRMIQLAVDEEIPRELAWLSGYDQAFERLDAELDLPRKDLSALIRMAQSQQGRLSLHRRKQYVHLPAAVLDRIEQVVCEAFGIARPNLAEDQEK